MWGSDAFFIYWQNLFDFASKVRLIPTRTELSNIQNECEAKVRIFDTFVNRSNEIFSKTPIFPCFQGRNFISLRIGIYAKSATEVIQVKASRPRLSQRNWLQIDL